MLQQCLIISNIFHCICLAGCNLKDFFIRYPLEGSELHDETLAYKFCHHLLSLNFKPEYFLLLYTRRYFGKELGWGHLSFEPQKQNSSPMSWSMNDCADAVFVLPVTVNLKETVLERALVKSHKQVHIFPNCICHVCVFPGVGRWKDILPEDPRAMGSAVNICRCSENQSAF